MSSKKPAKSARTSFPARCSIPARWPNWFRTSPTSAPLDTPVTDDAAYFLTASRAWKLPITPPPLRNHGNYVISLNKLVKWLGGLVEQAGVNVFTQFAGAELIYEGDAVAGVITEDKGRDKDGKPKDNFTPGYELRAKVTVLAEGPRGSLTKKLVAEKNLDGLNPQVYSIGVKELWEVPPGRISPGWVAHTLGWPLDSSMYGGGWVYGLRENRVSLGIGHRPRIPQSAIRSPRSLPALQDASLRAPHSRRRQAGALRRQDRARRRLVLHPADVFGRLPDRRRFREPAQCPAPEGHSHGHQERHARRRDDSGRLARGRYFRRQAIRLSPQTGRELDRERTARRAQFPSIVSARPLDWSRADRRAICHRRPRLDRSHAHAGRLHGVSQARRRRVRRPRVFRATACSPSTA